MQSPRLLYWNNLLFLLLHCIGNLAIKLNKPLKLKSFKSFFYSFYKKFKIFHFNSTTIVDISSSKSYSVDKKKLKVKIFFRKNSSSSHNKTKQYIFNVPSTNKKHFFYWTLFVLLFVFVLVNTVDVFTLDSLRQHIHQILLSDLCSSLLCYERSYRFSVI